MKKIKQEANELIESFIDIDCLKDLSGMDYEVAKECALNSIEGIIETIKSIINKTQEVHQSISTPTLMCKDILNPLLEHYEQVKLEIQKL